MIHVEYFALLREERGAPTESVKTDAATASELYAELRAAHDFRLDQASLMVSVNNAFGAWDAPLADGDTVGFLPPVSGG